jgi:hypothetical protein
MREQAQRVGRQWRLEGKKESPTLITKLLLRGHSSMRATETVAPTQGMAGRAGRSAAWVSPLCCVARSVPRRMLGTARGS